jgi:hypothetical protein
VVDVFEVEGFGVEELEGELALLAAVVAALLEDMGLKKGRERLPQPGTLMSQPVEIMSKSINIAEKMERLLNVSRNGSFPESVLVEF